MSANRNQGYSTSNEITTLDEAPPMQPPKTPQSTNDRSVRGGGDALVDNSNERTALLGNRRERVEAVESGVTVRRRPWSLRIDFFVAILLLSEFDHIVSLSFLSLRFLY